MSWKRTFVRVVRVSLSREVLAMLVHCVVQRFRARWRFSYSYSIWSRTLNVSMVHEFKFTIIFRFSHIEAVTDLPPENYPIG